MCSLSSAHSAIGALSPSQSSIGSSFSQCPTGVTSSVSMSETEDSTPPSASVGVGLGVSAVVANYSAVAMAKVETILLGLWKSSTFAVS